MEVLTFELLFFRKVAECTEPVVKKISTTHATRTASGSGIEWYWRCLTERGEKRRLVFEA